MRRDLRGVLDAFVASHRGLRSGHVFGAPAAFAGRRVFARLDGRALQLRLPPSLRREAPVLPRGEAKRSFRPQAGPSARSGARSSSDWVTITPSSSAAERLEMLLEQSARYVALA